MSLNYNTQIVGYGAKTEPWDIMSSIYHIECVSCKQCTVNLS